MLSARALVEGLYGTQGRLRLPWLKPEFPALVSMNTRKGELPYRFTWFTTVERTSGAGEPEATGQYEPRGHIDITKEEADALLTGAMPTRVKRRMIQNAKSLYTWSSGQLPPRPHPTLKDRPSFAPGVVEGFDFDADYHDSEATPLEVAVRKVIAAGLRVFRANGTEVRRSTNGYRVKVRDIQPEMDYLWSLGYYTRPQRPDGL